MPTLIPDDMRDGVDLQATDADWLHQLVADWQLVADLSVADLVLWTRTHSGRFVAIDQCRPSTGTTVHPDDVLRRRMPASREVIALETLQTCQIQVSDEPYWTGSTAVREEYIPVVRGGKAVAVVTRESSVGVLRGGRLIDESQERLADVLCTMIAQGTFPIAGAPTGVRHGTPRVSDGVLALDAEGVITYSSPNATSCFHRLGVEGDLEGVHLAEAVTDIIPERTAVEETMAVVLMGRQAWMTELEVGGVFLVVRSVPLNVDGQRSGALLLVRDVTEIRRREQVLMTKDATIREIHHRVKNNLQTVSALLRMQSRRTDNPDAKNALLEAERRVATIATVHEALSQNINEQVNFDEVFGQVLRMAAVVATSSSHVTTCIEGSFGMVAADAAQSLATVLAELVTNAVEHGLEGVNGCVTVRAHRDDDQLEVHVIDNGVGMDLSRIRTGLGTQIIGTLVRGELRGTIDWQPGPHGVGTDVVIHARLSERPAR
ncbi:sensor histidine kinase [Actinomyces vulturis]|uniref:sensor histidine kinase n=1 Tax=Actinomyces vulturis TaxID=1857645 RepID=UPI00082CBB98|nr:PAS domain-containing sensor histidine kinase [Actinomyces vulturis]